MNIPSLKFEHPIAEVLAPPIRTAILLQKGNEKQKMWKYH
jgi:hypothetical protein